MDNISILFAKIAALKKILMKSSIMIFIVLQFQILNTYFLGINRW